MRFLLFLLPAFLCCDAYAQTCSVQTLDSADCGLSCVGSSHAFPQGQAPFSYLWLPGNQTTQIITNLCPGTYTVTVTDSNGCVSIDTAVINGSPLMNVWISSVTNPSCPGCSDGSATGSVNGGTPGYYPWWIPPAAFGMYTISGIPAGWCQFCVIDSLGCESCVDTVLVDPAMGTESFTNTQEIAHVELHDLAGRLIWNGDINEWNQLMSENQLNGIFVVTMMDREGTVTIRRKQLFAGH